MWALLLKITVWSETMYIRQAERAEPAADINVNQSLGKVPSDLQ
jgi:hypothetical protein